MRRAVLHDFLVLDGARILTLGDFLELLNSARDSQNGPNDVLSGQNDTPHAARGLTLYNDIMYDGKPIFKTRGLNILDARGQTLGEALRRRSTRLDNSSFLNQKDDTLSCSTLLSFGGVAASSRPSEEPERGFYRGALQMHYRIPLLGAALAAARPYRLVVVYCSQPVFDLHVPLARALDAVSVGAF